MKPYPKYKNSRIEWIGNVPEGWGVQRLKWACNFLYGESLSAQEREDGAIPVYGSNGIVGYHNRSITEKPCIIVGRKGSFGKVTFSEKKCYPIDTTYYIDCTSTKNYMRWLWYLLPLLKMDELSRDSAVPGLNREDAYRNIVTLPSLYEQKQIAAYLDRKTAQIDDLISKKQKLIELLKEKRAAIINQAVTKGLNPDAPMKDSGVEWLGEIPAHWEVMKLKWLAKIRLSNIDKKSKEGELEVELCNYVDVYYNDNITSNIEFMKATARQDQIDILSLAEGDVLITKDSESPDDIAVPAYVLSSLSGVVCGYHLAHVRPYQKHANGNYLFWSFGTHGISDQFEISANGVTRFGIGKQAIDNSVFLSPPIEEQEGISKFIEMKTTEIDQTISKIKKQIDLLKEFRTALISEVVTGKIDVRDGGSNG